MPSANAQVKNDEHWNSIAANPPRPFSNRTRPWLLGLVLALAVAALTRSSTAQIEKVDGQPAQIVVIGDSITYSGQYVAYAELFLRIRDPETNHRWLNLGLPSETVSGLSEKGHAGGRFPRPDLHERLDRVLEQTNPDYVLACYGMNCGIYQPFSDQRFDAFRDGIQRLHDKATKQGAQVIHLTPPSFDSRPIQKRTRPADRVKEGQMYSGYNEVLDLYSAWLMAQRGQGWKVIDAHTPMNQFLTDQRRTKADFRLANDGVHINEQGHWLVAREILRAQDFENEFCDQATALEAFRWLKQNEKLKMSEADFAKAFKLVRIRQKSSGLAWLTQTKHKRPGIPKGSPLKEAETISKKTELELKELLLRK